MTNAIETRGLTKDYGGRGLFDLDLDIRQGEVFGYLGPNGAGKTTTIRLLMGFVRATSGSAKVLGLDCWRQAVEVKRHVGYLPGELPQFGGLRGAEVVAMLEGMRGPVDQTRVADLATRLDLDLGMRFREYSRGNKQKLGIVLALAHRPKLLILDEPTGGLDPLNQQTFYEFVDEAKADGATVFCSSHVLSEVERLCERIAIIRHGRLIEVATMAGLHHLHYRRVDIEYAGPIPDAAIRAVPGVDSVDVDDGHLTCAVHGAFDPFLAAATQGRIVNFTSNEPSLEEVFLARYRDEDQEVA
ncbi:MAG: ABC transporter ATP-binding protein [Candidatus Dormiibacterota bacterium]